MAMAYRQITWVLFVTFLVCLMLFIVPVLSDNDEEDNLLQGLNSYRTSLRLPTLVKNKNVGCLADEIADELEHRTCTSTVAANAVPAGSGSQFVNYPKLLKKCNIDQNTTTDGVILPVCVRHLVPTLVLTNYTRTAYAQYLNDSKFTGAGVGSEDDWMVVVLTTSTKAGGFTSGTAQVVAKGLGYLLPMFLSLFVF